MTTTKDSPQKNTPLKIPTEYTIVFNVYQEKLETSNFTAPTKRLYKTKTRRFLRYLHEAGIDDAFKDATNFEAAVKQFRATLRDDGTPYSIIQKFNTVLHDLGQRVLPAPNSEAHD